MRDSSFLFAAPALESGLSCGTTRSSTKNTCTLSHWMDPALADASGSRQSNREPPDSTSVNAPRALMASAAASVTILARVTFAEAGVACSSALIAPSAPKYATLGGYTPMPAPVEVERGATKPEAIRCAPMTGGMPLSQTPLPGISLMK